MRVASKVAGVTRTRAGAWVGVLGVFEGVVGEGAEALRTRPRRPSTDAWRRAYLRFQLAMAMAA